MTPATEPGFVSLCSGIGGLDLGLEWAGWTCLAQVEVDRQCRAVLARHWPEVPRHDDIATFPTWWRSTTRPPVDLVCAGFPCQPVSDAGQRRALRPRLVLLENVAGLLARGMGTVLGDLAALGYDTRWDCLSAADAGAPHLRRRVFILAHPADAGLADPDGLSIAQPHRPAEAGQPPPRRTDPAGRGPAVANPHGGGRPAGVGPLPEGESDACWGGALADPQGQRRPFGSPPAQGPWRPPGGGAAVADAGGAGRQGPLAGIADGRPRAARCRDEPADRDAAEPGVGGGPDGLPARMDRPADPRRWPAPPGQPPQPWEPSRTIAGRHPGRTARLSRLGNAVVPQVGALAGRWALATLHQLEAPAGGTEGPGRWPA